ncbi:MAG: serine hydrolase, partial [Candidatus Bathyarchaeota archaeon]|nr:serine hydrolase [Candidatus Bathyarchaeota archaeon]
MKSREFISKIKKYMKEFNVPGSAVGILHGEETLTKGLGVTNVDHPLPVTATTLFQIGSISKTYTGTAVMRMVEAGKIELDAKWGSIAQFTEKSMKKTGVPGVAVGILHQGATVTGGFGVTNVDHPLPVAATTLFQIGSI